MLESGNKGSSPDRRGPERKTDEEIAQIIGPKGFEIRMPLESKETFGDVNTHGLEGLSPNGINALQTAANATRKFLGGIYIIDSYGHEQGPGGGRQARNDAWLEIEKTLGAAIAGIRERDKMRLTTHLNPIKGFIDWLVVELDKQNIQTPKADLIRRTHIDLLAAIPDTPSYASMSYEEKEVAVQKLDAILRPFMRVITSD